ncbi:hypothetical protein BEP19_06600 [Ammoniphilus oxalaticus]|uniref:Sporulation protein n=1 Tax=Ammoniphilus oxalaticus TaxID=66863 RepID=A0A419SJ56_9BACL|nr:YhcN/YlaJ family sporulation lipoprotein [Ammoniphilus oxalaticus]RKD24074.1 hypothetical protein BEP19_06600 [Ammoniphilus oxalaticus]
MAKCFLSMTLTATLLLTGCQLGNQDRNNVTVQETQRAPQTSETNKEEITTGETANRLARIATRVPHVNDSTVIILGKTAIVGIDVDAKLDRPRVGTVKYTVAEALKKDPYGKATVVVADPDVMQRLREMNQDIKNGKPIAGFAEELADIVGRIMPQFPKALPQNEPQREIGKTQP